MDLRNLNFCQPRDKKFQNPFKMMSTATSASMDFTMVPLDGGKLSVSPPPDFTQAKSVFKNATLKCHQPSYVTIGGFVGSKSQTRSYISNTNQLYDVLIGQLSRLPEILKLAPYMIVDSRCFATPATSPHPTSSQISTPENVTHPPEASLNKVRPSKTESVPVEGQRAPEMRSYAEVARMTGAKADCPRVQRDSVRRFQRNTRDKGRPRSIQGNWREREAVKDIRRDREFSSRKSEDAHKHKFANTNDLPHWQFAKNPENQFGNFKSASRGGNGTNKRTSQWNKRVDGVKNRIIHEKHPNFNKTPSSSEQAILCADSQVEGCSNWRCRQPHAQKSNPNQEMRQKISTEIREYIPPKSLSCLFKQLPIRVLEKMSPSQTPNSSPNLKEKYNEALNSIRESSVIKNLARLGCSPREQRKDSTSSEEVVFRASECDSEDSFVVFETEDLSNSLDSSDSSDSEWSELEECNELSPWLTQINRKWDLESRLDIPDCSSPKKVKFNLARVVHPMVKWEFAYRNARCGPWEEMARDRERFRLRVSRVEPIISPILSPQHRDVIQLRIQSLRSD